MQTPETQTEQSAATPDVSPAALAPFIAIGASLAGAPEAGQHTESDAAALGLLIEVTHDLRSPLSSMLVLIEQLRSGQSGPLTRQQQLQLGLLYEATLEVSNLTQNALELARQPQAATGVGDGVGGGGGARGVGQAQMLANTLAEEFSIAHVWQSVRSLVAPIAQEKGLTLRWAGPSPEADKRLGQPALLQRVLLNLVTNAIKNTTRGSVSVTAHETSASRVRFRVRDTGSGLSQPAQQLVGDLPHELETGETPLQKPSRTLGLSMCASFLRSVGSRLELGANDGPGACIEFEVDLPQCNS